MLAPQLQFTYNYDPGAQPRDAVRFFIGDTDRNHPLVDDREISFALTKFGGNQLLAAILILEALVSKFAREADIKVGDVSKKLSDVSKTFQRRVIELRADLGTTALPFFGGRSISGKELLASDFDAIQPHFSMGQQDSYRALQFDVYQSLIAIGYWQGWT